MTPSCIARDLVFQLGKERCVDDTLRIPVPKWEYKIGGSNEDGQKNFAVVGCFDDRIDD